MKFLYLYLGKCGRQRGWEANFCPDYRFHFAYERKDFEVEVCRPLPDLFWSVAGVGNVDAVSAVVGANGAGKTSVARCLRGMFSNGRSAAPRLAILEIDGRLHLFGYMDSLRWGQVVASVRRSVGCEVFEHFGECLGYGTDFGKLFFFYSSPYFAHGGSFRVQERGEPSIFDYSSTRLLTALQEDDAPNPIRRYNSDELIRIMTVLREFLAYPKETRLQTRIVGGSRLIVRIERDALKPLNSLKLIRRGGVIGRAIPVLRELDAKVVRPNVRINWAFRVYAMAMCAYVDDLANVWIKKNRNPETELDELITLAEKVVAGEISEVSALIDAIRNVRIRDFHFAENVKALVRVLEFVNEFSDRVRTNQMRLSLNVRDGDVFRQLTDFVSDYSQSVMQTDYLELKLGNKLSSGEMSYLSLWGRLYEFILKNRDTAGRKHVLVFLDEAEVALHPEWQRLLVNNVIWLCEKLASQFQFHVIFASHSPMLLSDIPKSCVAFMYSLEKGVRHRQEQDLERLHDTFASNIFDLYRLSFFMNEGTMGEFSRLKIARLIKGDDADAESVDRIGDPMIRGYLERKLRVADVRT